MKFGKKKIQDDNNTEINLNTDETTPLTEKKQAPKKKSVFKIIKKVLLGILITSILLPIFLFILIHMGFMQNAIKHLAENYVLKNYGVYVKAGSLDFNLLKPRIHLQQVLLGKCNTVKNCPPFFKAQNITLELPLATLWSDVPVIKKLVIEKPELYIRIFADGSSNLPTFPTSEEETVLPEFICHLLSMPACKITFQDDVNQRRLEIPSLSLNLQHRSPGAHQVQIKMQGKGRISLQGQNFSIDRIALDSLLKGKSIRIYKGEFNGGGLSLLLNGTLENYLSAPVLAGLKIDASVVLNEMRRFLSAATTTPPASFPDKINGTMRLQSKLDGTLDNPKARVFITSTAVSATLLGVDDAPLQCTGKLVWQDHVLTVPWVQLKWQDNGEVGMNGTLYPYNWSQGSSLNIKVRALNLDSLHGLTGITAPLGKLNASLSVSYNTRYITIDLPSLIIPGLKAAGSAAWKVGAVSPLTGGFLVQTTRIKEFLPGWESNRPLEIQTVFSGSQKEQVVRVFLLHNPIVGFQAEGRIKSVAPYPVEVTLQMKDMPAENLLKLLNISNNGVQSNITGLARIRLNLTQPLQSLQMDANLDKIVLKKDTLEIANNGPMELSYNNEGITIKRMKWQGKGLDVDISGQLRYKEQEDMWVNAAATIDLKTAEMFLPGYQLKGKMELEALITGSLTAPRFDAYVYAKDVFINSPDLPGPLENAQLNLALGADYVTIKSSAFRFMDTKYSLEIPCRIGWQNDTLTIPQLAISGGGNRFVVEGAATRGKAINKTTPNTQLQFSLQGKINHRSLRNIIPDTVIRGSSDFSFLVTGTTDKPTINGSVQLKGAGLELQDPNIIISGVTGEIKVNEKGIRFEGIKGDVNDGKLNIAGSYNLAADATPDQRRITFNLDKVKLQYPAGLQSEVSGQLYFQSDTQENGWLLKGDIRILQALFKDVSEAQTQSSLFLHPITPENTLYPKENFLNKLFLDIRLATKTPIWVDKKISKAEITADVMVTGTAARPGLLGRGYVKSGGEIYYNKRTFIVERGIMDFNNPEAIEPNFDIEAYTTISSYKIKLQLTGNMDTMVPIFTSSPVLSQTDILSLLLTGQIGSGVSNFRLDEQAFSLAKQLAAGFAGEKIEKISGIDNIRIDTGLQDKEARVTLSERVAKKVELVFSQNLTNTQKRSYIARYSPWSNVQLEGQKTEDNEYGIGFNHQISFNTHKKTPPAAKGSFEKPPLDPAKLFNTKKKVMNIRVTGGNIVFPVNMITKRLKTKVGKSFDYLRFSADLESLHEFYREQGYLAVVILPERVEKDGGIHLGLDIAAGPKITLVYRGAEIPNNLRKEVAQILWSRHFGALAFNDAVLRLKYFLYQKQFYQAKVTCTRDADFTDYINEKETAAPGLAKQIIFDITPGLHTHKLQFNFSGNTAIADKELAALFHHGHMTEAVFADPVHVIESLKHIYFLKGFLQTQIEITAFRFTPTTLKAEVFFAIKEGALSRIGKITFTGNQFIDNPRLLKTIGFRSRNPFSPSAYNEATFKIKSLYLGEGFSKCTVQAHVEPDKTPGLLNISFLIVENQQAVIQEITLEGNLITHDNVILKQLAFKKGDILSFPNINKTRKALYDLGIFQQVAIVLTPLPMTTKNQVNQDIRPYRVEVHVNEQKRFRFKYGVQLQSTLLEDAPLSYGVNTQFSDYNLFGAGHYADLVVGISNKERKVIGYLGTQNLFSRRFKSQLFLHYTDKEEPAFTLKSAGIGVQQKIAFTPFSSLAYNYNLSWNRQKTFAETEFSDSYSYRLGAVEVIYNRDKRNNIMDTVSGSYHNYSIGMAERVLGSEVNFLRLTGHYSYYKQFGALVYAGAVRMGFITDFDTRLPIAEKFFTGGGTSIRGYAQNKVGPLNSLSEPIGGNAFILLNQELRLRLTKLFGAVVFLDVGNVYPRLSDFLFSELRKGIGVGLRFHTPFVIFRLDWGFKLGRRPGESASTIFFSIGQAF